MTITECTYGGIRHFDVTADMGCDDVGEHPVQECEVNLATTSTCVTSGLSMPEGSVDSIVIGIAVVLVVAAGIFVANVWK